LSKILVVLAAHEDFEDQLHFRLVVMANLYVDLKILPRSSDDVSSNSAIFLCRFVIDMLLERLTIDNGGDGNS
jgi:hypothetical protein